MEPFFASITCSMGLHAHDDALCFLIGCVSLENESTRKGEIASDPKSLSMQPPDGSGHGVPCR